MTYTAFSYFVLVSVQMTLILANELSTTSNYGHYTPSVSSSTTNTSDSSVTAMSTVTNYTMNGTEISNANFTTKGQYSPNLTPTPPGFTSKPPSTTTTAKSKLLEMLTTPQPSGDGVSVGIIIIIVLIAIALLAGLICYVSRSKGRRYSVDLTSRPDEAQIPLSNVEPVEPVENTTLNGLQFEGMDGSTHEPQETEEPEVKTEDKVKMEVDAEKETVDEATECAAPAADTSEDAKQDVPEQDVPEQDPSAPVEPSEGEKTDDAGAASDKTSVESLKESNEVNENNSKGSVEPQRGAGDGEAFWDTSLDSSV